MANKHHQKLLLTLSTFLSLGCLTASFGGDLTAYKVYETREQKLFGEVNNIHIITEKDEIKPFGFDEGKATLLSQNLNSKQNIKFGFLAIAIIIPGFLIFIDPDITEDLELESEISDIKRQGKKELALQEIKHKLAMKSKAHQLLFLEEMKALVELGEDQYQLESKADDALESKQLQALNLMEDGYELETAVALAWQLERGSEPHTEVLNNFKLWLEKETV